MSRRAAAQAQKPSAGRAMRFFGLWPAHEQICRAHSARYSSAAHQEMVGQASSLSEARARSPCHQESQLPILRSKIH
jgi:hypothetical protein